MPDLDFIHYALILVIIFLIIVITRYYLHKKKEDVSVVVNNVPLQPKRISTDNVKALRKCHNILEITTQLSIELSTINLGWCVLGEYFKLLEFLESVGKEEWNIEALEKAVNITNVNTFKRDYERLIGEFSKLIIDAFNDTIRDLSQLVIENTSSKFSKYILNEEQVRKEQASISMILHQDINTIYIKYDDIEKLQKELNSALPLAKEILNGDIWLKITYDTVEGFLRGYLASQNPFMWLGNISKWASDYKKDKKNKEYMDTFSQIFDTYLNEWDNLIELYKPIWKDQHNIISRKIKHTSRAILLLIKMFAEEGVDLEKCYLYLQNDLDEIKAHIIKEYSASEEEIHEQYKNILNFMDATFTEPSTEST